MKVKNRIEMGKKGKVAHVDHIDQQKAIIRKNIFTNSMPILHKNTNHTKIAKPDSLIKGTKEERVGGQSKHKNKQHYDQFVDVTGILSLSEVLVQLFLD